MPDTPLRTPLPTIKKKSGLFSGKDKTVGLHWGTLHWRKSFLPFCEMWVGVRVRLYCVLFVNNFMKIPGMDTCNSCRYNQVFLHRHAGTKAQAKNSENIEPRILAHPSFLLKDVIYFRYKSTISPRRPAVAVILTLQIIYCILGNLS